MILYLVETSSRVVGSLIIILYIYHALINALNAHMIHINLNTIFHTHVEHSPAKTIYIKYYTEKHCFNSATIVLTEQKAGYIPLRVQQTNKTSFAS